MVNITQKELMALEDLMQAEVICTAKCEQLAQTTQDVQWQDHYQRMAQRHRQHLDQLYANLK